MRCMSALHTLHVHTTHKYLKGFRAYSFFFFGGGKGGEGFVKGRTLG